MRDGGGGLGTTGARFPERQRARVRHRRRRGVRMVRDLSMVLPEIAQPESRALLVVLGGGYTGVFLWQQSPWQRTILWP